MATNDKTPVGTGVSSENFGEDSESKSSNHLPGEHLTSEDVLGVVPMSGLFHDTTGDPFITMEGDGTVRTLPLRSREFTRWMAARCYRVFGQTPNKSLVDQVMTVCEGMAIYDGEEREVFVRVGHHNGATYVDLGDPSGRAIEIDEVGYRLVDRPPIPFRRGKGFGVLPEPESGGNVYDLAPILNLDGDDLDLVIVFLLSTLRPLGPYPVLYVSGEQGSAKTMASRLIRTLVDPNTAALRGDPKQPRDFLVTAEHAWVVGLDNLSSMPKGVADALCRLTSGTGNSVRQNYEDKEEVLFTATRPVIINGIPELTFRQDLADRALRVDCDPITDLQRRTESDVLRQFHEVWPLVLGALLDATSTALRRTEMVARRIQEVPRLADVAIHVEAAAPALGWDDGKGGGLMLNSRSAWRQSVLSADPLAAIVTAFAKKKGIFAPWTGTATELLKDLAIFDPAAVLPTAANVLSGQLRQLAPALRDEGVDVKWDRVGHGSRRSLIIKYKDPKTRDADDADGARQ